MAKTLPEYKNLIETKLGVTKTLVTDVEDLYKWTEEMRVKVALRNMTDEEIKLSKITLREKETLYENLDSTYWVLAQDTESKGLTVSVALKVCCELYIYSNMTLSVIWILRILANVYVNEESERLDRISFDVFNIHYF